MNFFRAGDEKDGFLRNMDWVDYVVCYYGGLFYSS